MGMFSKAMAEFAPVDKAPAQDTLPTSLRKGWNSGVLGVGSQLQSVAGLAGEALGADEFAANRNAAAASLRQEAEAAAPQIGKWADVNGLRDFGNYAAGMIGGSAPVSLAAMGAAAATGGGVIPGMLAAGAVTALPEMGDVIQKQQADPEAMQQSVGTRLGNAALGGLGSAAFQGVVPGIVGKQLMGHGAAGAVKQSFKGIVGKNVVGAAALEAGAEGGGDVIKQFASNQDKDIDWDSVKENAIGGAVGGGAMGSLGAAGTLTGRVAPQMGEAMSSSLSSIKDRFEGAKGAAGDALDAAAATPTGKKVSSVYDSVADMVEKGRTKLDDTVDRMMSGKPLGATDDEISKSTPERIAEILAQSAKTGAAKAQEWGSEMVDKMVDGDPRRQAVVDAMANVGEEAGQRTMAGLKKAWDMGNAAASKLDDLMTEVGAKYKGARTKRASADVDVESRWVTEPGEPGESGAGGALGLGAPDAAAPAQRTTDVEQKPSMNARRDFIAKAVESGMTPDDARAAYIESLNGPRRDVGEPPKFSQDYSGVEQSILTALTQNGLAKRRPDLFEDPRTRAKFGGVMRTVLDQLTTGQLDGKVVRKLTNLLGDDTEGIINSMRRAVKGDLDAGEAESFFKNINTLRDAQQSSEELNTQLKSLMSPEAATQFGSGFGLMETADLGMAFARGELISATDSNKQSAKALTAADMATNAKVKEFFVQRFGNKADAALDLIGNHVGMKRSKDGDFASTVMDEDGNMKEAGDASFNEDGERQTAENLDVMYVGAGKDERHGSKDDAELLMHPDLFKSSNQQGLNRGLQAMMNAKDRFSENGGDPRTVRFEYAKGSTTHGHVVAERAGNPDGLSEEDVNAMRLEKGRSKSPDRIEIAASEKTGGRPVIIDSWKVAHVMHGRLDRGALDNNSSPERMARMFIEGVARLTEKYGTAESPIVIPASVRIARLNGKDLTWGEAQKLGKVRRTASDRAYDSNTEQMNDARLELKGLDPEDNARRFELEDLIKKIEDDRETLKAEGLGLRTVRGPGGKKRVVDTTAGNGVDDELTGEPTDPDKTGNIHVAARRLGGGKPVFANAEELDGGGEKTGRQLMADKRDTKANESLLNKSNMDGSGHYAQDKGATGLNTLTMAIYESWSEAPSAGAKAVTRRAKALIANASLLSAADLRKLQSLAPDPVEGVRNVRPASVADAREVINDLARKYKDVIMAPSDGARGEATESADGGKGGRNTFTVLAPKYKERGPQNEMFPLQPNDSGGVVAESKGATKPAPKAPEAAKPNMMATNIAKRQDYLNNSPADYSTEKTSGIIDWASTQLERVDAEVAKLDKLVDDPNYDEARHELVQDLQSDLRALAREAKAKVQNDKDMAGVDKKNGSDLFGGNPDPKSVAAKKAAFLSRAASGDPALLAELSSSTDAKGLQRALDLLNSHEFDGVAEGSKAAGNVEDAYGAINARLSELVQDEDVAYGLQTKKYSLESTRKGYSTTRTGGDKNNQMRISDVGEIGPIDNAMLATHANEDGTGDLTMYLFDMQHGDSDGAVMEFDLYKNDDGEWEIGMDGPRPGTGAAKRLAEKFTYSEFEDPYNPGDMIGYSKFHDGVFSRTEVRQMLRTLRDHAKELGVTPEAIVFGRDTSVNAGRPYVTLSAEQISRFSNEATDPTKNNAAGVQPSKDIKAYIEKVLGKSVKLAWANFSHAGEFQRMKSGDIIRLSVHALNPMSTAYHESLHAFIAQLKDAGAHDIVDVLYRAAGSQQVINQLNEIYKNQPAVLQQLKDPEERAAYMYQIWAANPQALTLGPATRNVFQKMADFVRSVLGIWSNDERALHIMRYFNDGSYAQSMGTPNATRRALMDPGRNKAVEAAKTLTVPLGKLADALLSTGDARLRDTNIPALNQLADLIKRSGTDTGGDQGYIPAARIAATKQLSAMAETLSQYTPETLTAALNVVQSKGLAGTPEVTAAVQDIRAILRDTKRYMERAGVKMGDLGSEYFPRVWDTHYISQNEQAFRNMLEPYVRSGEFKGNPSDFIRNLTSRMGNEFGIETSTPGMQFTKKRDLDFLKAADVAPFLEKDLMGTLGSYITQATRRAEWERRLGGWDEDLKETQLMTLMRKAKEQGATSDDLKVAGEYLKGVDGTLGDNINPHARRIMGNMIVYQNVRLLPMAMFSMLIDPMGVLVRGGNVGEAFSTFKRGMTSIPETFGRKTTADEATRLAELVGVIDAAVLSHVMGDVYTQGMVGGTAKKINNAFFKYNMVEGLNRSFRVGASEAAMSFIARHADMKGRHSRRWLAELGLQAGDIKMLSSGAGVALAGSTAKNRIALTRAEGLTKDQETRIHAAINQWVDGAMLRPDAADKPIWMNDPHYALISHLKQFVFSFQKTILGRVMHEMRHGNYTPAMALASYVPMMIAADTAKGLIQGGGDTPEWKKNWGVTEYVGYGIQRAGLLGVGQFGLDVAEDVGRGGSGFGALSGPTLEQFADAVQLMGGKKQFGPMLLDAMPANALYKESLGGNSDGGPMHSE